jgi:hypothetical protein
MASTMRRVLPQKLRTAFHDALFRGETSDNHQSIPDQDISLEFAAILPNQRVSSLRK